MARAGDELHNPVTGQRLVFRRTTADTGGDLLEVESVWAPGGVEPVAHFHPKQDEHFAVLEGRLAARVGREERVLEKGDVLDVPAAAVHSMWNAHDGETRAVWRTTPALETEAFFETAWGLAQDGKVDAKGVPGLLQVGLMAREFDDEFRLAKPPRPVQQVVFAVLAPLARMRGLSGRYRASG